MHYLESCILRMKLVRICRHRGLKNIDIHAFNLKAPKKRKKGSRNQGHGHCLGNFMSRWVAHAWHAMYCTVKIISALFLSFSDPHVSVNLFATRPCHDQCYVSHSCKRQCWIQIGWDNDKRQEMMYWRQQKAMALLWNDPRMSSICFRRFRLLATQCKHNRPRHKKINSQLRCLSPQQHKSQIIYGT